MNDIVKQIEEVQASEAYNDLDLSIKSELQRIKNTADEKSKGATDIENIWQRMNAIEEKSRCARVRFLDWVSAKLLAWSQAAHSMADNIHSPCAIKLPAKEPKPAVPFWSIK